MNSSRQKASDFLKEKMPSSHENQNLKGHVKQKAQNPFSQPYHNPLYELRSHAVYERKVQVKSSEDGQKSHVGSNTIKDDELVKYMSKIPGYLQQVEKGKNIQERALNFGVLDFKRLEKWKYNERMPGKCHRKFPSSISDSFSMARRPPRLSTTQVKQPSQSKLHVSSSHERKLSEGAQQLQGNFQKSTDAPSDKTYGDQKFLHGKVKSCRGDQIRLHGSFSEIDNHKSKWKELDEKPISKLKALSANQDTPAKFDIARTCGVKNNIGVKEEGGLTHRRHATEPQNIVLLVPKNSSKLSCSESSQFVESMSSCDRQFEAMNVSKLSDCFSPRELHSGELFSEVPHSCPLPTFDALSANTTMKSECSMNTPCRGSDVSMASCPNEMLMSLTTLEAKGPNLHKSSLEPSIPTEPSKKMEMAAAEQQEVKGRHPSPNRRFSFSSLGRLSRSLSFKDSSAVPQLSSNFATIKSGPVGTETAAGMGNYGRDKASTNYVTIKSGPISTETAAGTGNCSRDKASTSGRGRSSPLRRLLDPLMKPRGKHSAEAVQPTGGNKNFVIPKPMNSGELLQVKNNSISSFQALLQLTVKNDLPFFKLGVENSNDILAATVKNIQKDDLSLAYAFYSVHEIKKKSVGWMSQGSKNKSCSFGYNTIGQMKMSNHYMSDSTAPDSNMWLLTECSLYDLDPKEEGIKTPEQMTKTEVAAILVKNPVEIIHGEQANEDHQCKQNYLPCTWGGRNGNFSSTTVILPGGLHGLPSQGAPSSLIDRWRSGGSCDCGGWDIGCKLRILTNQDMTRKTKTEPKYLSNRVNLFTQSGEPESKPIFSLAPFENGLYSVEFNASVSLLEAFSICVAIITTRKFSGILELKSPSEAKRTSEVMTGSDSTKTPPTNQGQLPAKYVTSPPPSPVGRI